MSASENQVTCPYCGKTTDQQSYCPHCQQYFVNEPIPLTADPASYGTPVPRPYPPPNAPRGIGGWLILPAIGLVVSPLMMLRTIYDNLTLLNTFSAVEARYPALRAALIGEILITAGLLGLQVYVAVLFFKTSRELPKMITILLAVNLVLVSADVVWVSAIIGKPTGVEQVLRAVVAACVWIPYFNRSERVKATFVN